MVHLGLDTEQDPLHCRLLHFSLHLFEVLSDLLFEVFSVFPSKKVLPVSFFRKVCALNCAPITRLNDFSSLILQEEPLCRVVKDSLVDIVHLLSQDQPDYVQVSIQFFLTSLESFGSPLCLSKSTTRRTLLLTARQPIYAV